MISNKKNINYKVLDVVELYNFDINFIFMGSHGATVLLHG